MEGLWRFVVKGSALLAILAPPAIFKGVEARVRHVLRITNWFHPLNISGTN